MWIPLCKSSELTDKPLRKVYWGTPVALFRTPSGALNALEDACGHRAVPLSLGKVRGESLRCGYHHFAFDGSGACTSAPANARLDEASRRACTVHRFYTREAIGLVWVSADAEAVFPVDEEKYARATVVAGFFPLAGHAQVWLDHYLDYFHAVHTHAGSIYGGDDEHLAEWTATLTVPPDATYPLDAGRLEFVPGGTSGLFWGMYLSGSLPKFLRGLLSGARAKPNTTVMDATLFSPACQRLMFSYGNGFGKIDLEIVTFLNPIAERANVWTAISVAHRKMPEPIASIERYNMLKASAKMHILEEDGPYLIGTEQTDISRYHLAPVDASLLGTRAMFARYVAAKGHLYPRDSMLLKMPAAAGVSFGNPVVPLRVRSA